MPKQIQIESARDIIAILEALKQAGSLQADLILM